MVLFLFPSSFKSKVNLFNKQFVSGLFSSPHRCVVEDSDECKVIRYLHLPFFWHQEYSLSKKSIKEYEYLFGLNFKKFIILFLFMVK